MIQVFTQVAINQISHFPPRLALFSHRGVCRITEALQATKEARLHSPERAHDVKQLVSTFALNDRAVANWSSFFFLPPKESSNFRIERCLL